MLATGCTILGNIRVGDGAIINAGSVVTKEILPYTQVSGIPAKIVAVLKPIGVSEKYEAIAERNVTYKQMFRDAARVNTNFPKLMVDYSDHGVH